MQPSVYHFPSFPKQQTTNTIITILHNFQLCEILQHILIHICNPLLREPLSPAVLGLRLLQMVLDEVDHIQRVYGIRLR